ncbi:methyl-accepting chemotaxis protein [Sporosarcina sp. Te-1]|uniref:methyl-accepting chemotaxis protein n=1 Tax=Sporosarcina sp. Te-1 TaxID=2818390 RepID=UPI001A9DD99E|nr:HAMP domain-containing methyl-accepting chemotaxis protein [Sporosarcina sp. Te-1]QTD41467.1 HAMP domain-containing protein [Sporosarcina sp. Te-1]
MRLSVSKRIWFGFSILLILMLLIGSASFISTKKMNDEFAFLLDDRMHKISLADELINAQNKRYIAISSYVLFKTKEFVEQRDESTALAEETIADMNNSFTASDNRELVEELSAMHGEFSQMVEDISYMLMRSNETQNRVLLKQASVLNEQMIDKANELKAKQLDEMASSRKSLENMTVVIHIITFGLILAGLILSIIVTNIINKKIGLPVKKMTSALEQIAAGDLTIERVTIRNKDEIGDMASAFNRMVADVKQLLEQIRYSSHQLAAQAEQLSASSEESLASSEMVASASEKNMRESEQQTELINNQAASVSTLSSDVTAIANSNDNMLDSMQSVVSYVTDGSHTVQEVSGKMSQIQKTIQEASDIIQMMAQQSAEIHQVTSLITAISDQTNLLALNAAIEAARAGEHGKGFAVVAEEVRKLAEQSKTSATEIERMIESIQTATKKAVVAINLGSSTVESGKTETDNSLQLFHHIEQAVEEVNGNVNRVTIAIDQIRSMTDSISNSSQQIQRIAESAAFTAQETSAATEEQLAVNEEISTSSQTLASLAESLQKEVNRFTF